MLLIASVVAVSVVAGGTALAALGNTPEGVTVQANGRVWDILRAGDKVYLAGAFTQLTDKSGATFARSNLAAVDADTGRVTPWNPSVTNAAGTSRVHAMALSSGRSRLFVGGAFSRVGGLPRGRLAAVDLAGSGAAVGGWRADADKSVYALAVSGSRLFVGGSFTTLAGQPRERLAAVSSSTGAPDAGWRPSARRGDGAASSVRALEVSGGGDQIYAGGTFNQIGSTRTGRLAALDARTGSLASGFKLDYPNAVLAMDLSGSRLYVGTGDPLEGVEALDATTGQVLWSVPGGRPDPGAGDVQAVRASGTKVYAGGHFTRMGGLVRKRLVEVDAATGRIGPWAPDVANGGLGVWALETDPVRGRLYAGGDFVQVGGTEKLRFAQFSGL